jgi:hypothetical protein
LLSFSGDISYRLRKKATTSSFSWAVKRVARTSVSEVRGSSASRISLCRFSNRTATKKRFALRLPYARNDQLGSDRVQIETKPKP